MTAGSSIAPVSVSFTGSIKEALLQVTSVSSGSIQLGVEISGPGIPAGAQIVTQLSGTPGGVGVYSLFDGTETVSTETMTETYGVLTAGTEKFGTVAVGQEVFGAGVLPITAIDRPRPRKHLACQQRPNGCGREHDNDGDSPLSRLGFG